MARKAARPDAAPRPGMELRKLQLTGGASFTVTLPKDWVERSELAAGDVVGFLPQLDGSLALYAKARADAPATLHEVEVTNEDTQAAFRRIVAAYLAGYDVIVLRGKRPLSVAVRRAVRLASRRIIGIEIVEEEPHAITLQDFLDPREFHMDKGLRRMAALTRAMQDDAVRAFAEDAPDLDEVFQERDDEVDRLYWMINKQYHAVLRDPAYGQRMGMSSAQALNHLLAARLVERTADHAHRIAKNAQAVRDDEVQGKLQAKIEKQARRACQLFAEAVSAFHQHDIVAADRIIEDARAFKGAQDNLLRESLSLGGESMLHVALLMESVGRTAAYAADVAETAINHRVAMAT